MGIDKKHTYEDCLGDLSKSDRENLQSWKVGSSDDTLSNHQSYKSSRYKNTAEYIFNLANAGKRSSLRAGLPLTNSTPPATNPPVSADVDSFGNPVRGSANFKDFRDMDCSEFKIFYYNIRNNGPLAPIKNLQAFSSGLDIEGRSDFDDKSYQCQDTF